MEKSVSAHYLIPLENTDLIAIVAAIISGLSALYARWAASQAKRANEISLLGHRKAIFDAFFELKMHMGQQAGRAQMEQVSKFYYPSRDASIYFEKSLSDKIANYYDQCFGVADIARIASELEAHEKEKIQKLVSDASALAPIIEREISSILRRSTIKS